MEKIQNLVTFMLLNNKEPKFVLKDTKMKKYKRVHYLNILITRIENYTDTQITENYKYTLSTLQKILEISFHNYENMDKLLNEYSIDKTNPKELRFFILELCTNSLELIESNQT